MQSTESTLDKRARPVQNKELVQQILRIANSARESGQDVQIESMLPTVSIMRGDGDEFFFQEHQADDILEKAQKIIVDLGEEAEMELSVEDVLLYQAQNW